MVCAVLDGATFGGQYPLARVAHPLGATALLSVYGLSMTLSVPAADRFQYCVFPLAVAMPLLATSKLYPLNIKALLARTRRDDWHAPLNAHGDQDGGGAPS